MSSSWATWSPSRRRAAVIFGSLGAVIVIVIVMLLVIDNSAYKSQCQQAWNATFGNIPAGVSGAPSEGDIVGKCEDTAQQVTDRCNAHGGVQQYISYEQNDTNDTVPSIPDTVTTCDQLAKYMIGLWVSQTTGNS